MIKAEDVESLVQSTWAVGFNGVADRSDALCKTLNDCLSDPQTRAAMVRELIASGWCSPSACVVRRLDNNEFVSLHVDELEAAAKVREMRDRNPKRFYGISHWKGKAE